MSISSVIELMKLVGLWTLLFIVSLPLLLAATLVVSAIAWGLRYGLSKTGFDKMLSIRRLRRLRRLFIWPLATFRRVHDTLAAPTVLAVRVVIDERLTHLRETMLNVRDATREACLQIDHLGKGGHTALETDIRDLERRTQDVAALGGAIDEDLVKDYQGRARASGDLVLAVLLMAVFMVANGVLLNLYLETWIPNYMFGVPVSLFAAIAFVGMEFGAGWLIARNTPERGEADENALARWVFILVAFWFCLFEGFALGTLSASWDWDLDLFVRYPWTRYWLAIVGFVIVPVTTGIGFQFDMLRRRRAEHVGALRLKREIKAANRYVDELPERWATIGERARSAIANIESYAEALGGKADNLKGSVDRIKQERQTFVGALAAASFDDWNTVFEGNAGDSRQRAVLDLGLCIGAAAILIAFTVALGWVLQIAFAGRVSLDRWLWLSLAAVAGLGLAGLGFLPFQRLQMADAPSGRVFPMRNASGEFAIAAVIGVAAAIGLIAVSMAAFGWKGAFVGLLLVAGGAFLAMIGYFFERVMRGAVAALVMVSATTPAAVAGLLAVTVHVLAWPLAGLFWLLWGLISFLARPTEWLHELWRARQVRKARAQTTQPAVAAE